jgi:hypothetical protein
MKKTIFYCISIILFYVISAITIASINCNAQDNTRIYTNIDFNKVLPERVNDYLNLEGKMWKPIQQEHLKEGGIVGWNVFRVWFTGTGSTYNYAVMELYPKYENMSFVYSDNIITKVLPGVNEKKLMDDTYHAREIVKAQSAVRIAMVFPDSKKSPSSYVIVTYLDVKKTNTAEFEKNVNDIAIPLMKERMKAGFNEGWDLFKTILPSGDIVPYQFISMEYISGMDIVVKTGGPDATRGMEPSQCYRTELWERVESLDK